MPGQPLPSVHGGLPGVGVQVAVVAHAPAAAVEAALHAIAALAHDLDVQAHERADIGHVPPAGADDVHRLPLAGEPGGDLLHARIAGAGVGVDLLQQRHLAGEGDGAERVVVGVEVAVGADGVLGHVAGMAVVDGAHGVAGARDGVLGQLVGVGVAGGVVGHGAQPEALGGVVAGALQAAVVPGQGLALAVLHVEFAVVGAREGVVDQALDARTVQARALEEELVRLGGLRHDATSRGWAGGMGSRSTSVDFPHLSCDSQEDCYRHPVVTRLDRVTSPGSLPPPAQGTPYRVGPPA